MSVTRISMASLTVRQREVLRRFLLYTLDGCKPVWRAVRCPSLRESKTYATLAAKGLIADTGKRFICNQLREYAITNDGRMTLGYRVE